MARSSAKVCPIHFLIIPMSFLLCLLLEMFLPFSSPGTDRIASCQVHCMVLLNLVSCDCQLFNDSLSMHFHLSVLNKIWRSIACVGSDFFRRHVEYLMVKQQHQGEPTVEAETAGGRTPRGLKRVSRQFPIPSP